MKTKPSLVHYIVGTFIFLSTCLFCNMPNFHPEALIGQKYHWALDMLFHGGYFFMASIALQWLLSSYIKPYWICIALWVLAFILEIIQLWVPGRSFTLLDLTSNSLGIAAAFLLYRYGDKTWGKTA